MFHLVPISNRHLTDTSALTTCLQTANDNLKLERKRRQRQKQEEFLHQLKQKQSTNLTVSSDLQTKLLMDKNTGIHENFPEQRLDWKSAMKMHA